MGATKSFLKFLELLVKEDERTRAFKDYLEDKTGYSVFIDKIGFPGITDYFELNNMKISSPDERIRINSEMIRMSSTQLSSIVAAGKILLSSDTEIPLESLGAYGIFISIGPEDRPLFELYAREAIFEGAGLKIKYDSTTQEPEFTGTLSASSIESEISMFYRSIEIPATQGKADITFNLKTLTGNANISLSGEKDPVKSDNSKTKKERKEEKLSINSASMTLKLEFTLLPYSV